MILLKELLKEINLKFNCKIYAVGGAVRSWIQGKDFNDLDLITPEKPEVIRDCCLNLEIKPDLVGLEFGVIKFNYKFKNLTFKVEIATFRVEEYQKNLINPEIKFTEDLLTDLRRRDFRLNSICLEYNEKTRDFNLIDPFKGVSDLKLKKIRTINSPTTSFFQDPLRILRAIRIAGDLEFEISPNYQQIFKKNSHRLILVPRSKSRVELEKILSISDPSFSLNLMLNCGIFKTLLPLLTLERDFQLDSAEYDFDLWKYTLNLIKHIPENRLELRLAALFHGVAKPLTQCFVKLNKPSYPGFETLGEELTKSSCRWLDFPRARGEKVALLVKNQSAANSSLKPYLNAAKKLPSNFHRFQIVLVTGGETFSQYHEYLNWLKNPPKQLNLPTEGLWTSALRTEFSPYVKIIKPAMPNKQNAKYIEWEITMTQTLEKLDSGLETIFVGWSLGGIFLAKYLNYNLNKLHIFNHLKINSLHLMAAPAENCPNFEIPLLEVLKNEKFDILIHHSQDDPIVSFKQSSEYLKKLPNSRLIKYNKSNHFLVSKVEKFNKYLWEQICSKNIDYFKSQAND